MAAEITSLAVSDLLQLYVKVLDELRRRSVVRSTNNPVADYAEFLCGKALSLIPAPKSTKGYDGTCSSGHRYEIKARRITAHNSSRQLSAIRGLADAHFAYLVGVLFREDFSVWKACVVPHSAVVKHSKFIKHTNSHKFDLRDDVWKIEGVIDITEQVANAQRASHV